MNQKPSVHLRVFRGKELSYDANGVAKTENFKVALVHDTAEYWNFLKMFRANGYVKVDVEFVLDMNKKNPAQKFGYEEIEDISQYKQEVDEAFNADQKEVLTPDQKRIADLEAMVEKLMNKDAVSSATDEPIDADLTAARQSYMDITGKQGDKRWTVDTINQKIEEFKTQK